MKVLYYQYPENLDKISDSDPEGETTWNFDSEYAYEKIEILSFPGAQFQFGGTGLSAPDTYEIGPSGRFVLENVSIYSIGLTANTKAKIDAEFHRVRENDEINKTNDLFFAVIAYNSERNEK